MGFTLLSFLPVINNEIKKLRASIEENNEQTALQNKRMYNLTWAIAFLTLVMLGAVIIQIYLTISP